MGINGLISLYFKWVNRGPTLSHFILLLVGLIDILITFFFWKKKSLQNCVGNVIPFTTANNQWYQLVTSTRGHDPWHCLKLFWHADDGDEAVCIQKWCNRPLRRTRILRVFRNDAWEFKSGCKLKFDNDIISNFIHLLKTKCYSQEPFMGYRDLASPVFL